MDVYTEHLSSTVIAKFNLDVFGIVNDPPYKVLQRFLQHGHYSAASSGFSSGEASLVSGSGASGTTTEPLSGATNASFSAGCFMSDSSYSSPLNFCQSPVSFSKAVTCFDGCASTPSQYWARSESILMTDGSLVGW